MGQKTFWFWILMIYVIFISCSAGWFKAEGPKCYIQSKEPWQVSLSCNSPQGPYPLCQFLWPHSETCSLWTGMLKHTFLWTDSSVTCRRFTELKHYSDELQSVTSQLLRVRAVSKSASASSQCTYVHSVLSRHVSSGSQTTCLSVAFGFSLSE